jgi:hypothetical protein
VTTNSTTRTTTTKRFPVRSAIAAATLAVGAMLLSTGVAHAQSEESIKSDCESEVGGTYTTTVDPNGNTRSTCCYEGMTGLTHCDVYFNGEWDEKQSFHRPPVSAPTTPPAANHVPITARPPAAVAR